MTNLHYDIEVHEERIMHNLTQSEIIIKFQRSLSDKINCWSDVTNWCDDMGYEILCCETDYDMEV